jgi:hypothetical protein
VRRDDATRFFQVHACTVRVGTRRRRWWRSERRVEHGATGSSPTAQQRGCNHRTDWLDTEVDAGVVEVRFDSDVHPCCWADGVWRLVFDSRARVGVTTLSSSGVVSIESSTLLAFPSWLSSRCSLHTALTLAVAELSVPGGVEQLACVCVCVCVCDVCVMCACA